MGTIEIEYQSTGESYIGFSVMVVSGGFSGASNFGISARLLQEAVSSLSRMYHDLSGIYQIDDHDSDAFILFEFLNLGHLRVSGQVGGSLSGNYLRYELLIDQTDLKSLISSFRSMLSTRQPSTVGGESVTNPADRS
jgi:hypothetical protein